MDTFIYAVNPTRVVFGNGSIQKLPDEVARLKVSRPLLISGPRHAEHAESLGKILNGQFAGIFSEATMHGPVEVTNKAVEYVASIKADSFVSIGGGSAVGLGKALSIRTGFPHIAIPTTYSGSEMTSQLGETADGVKTTRIDPKIQPATVIYDADLTLSLPPNMSATSGVNAIAHAGM
jgi:alcohol dehydrogenase class IV